MRDKLNLVQQASTNKKTTRESNTCKKDTILEKMYYKAKLVCSYNSQEMGLRGKSKHLWLSLLQRCIQMKSRNAKKLDHMQFIAVKENDKTLSSMTVYVCAIEFVFPFTAKLIAASSFHIIILSFYKFSDKS